MLQGSQINDSMNRSINFSDDTFQNGKNFDNQWDFDVGISLDRSLKLSSAKRTEELSKL